MVMSRMSARILIACAALLSLYGCAALPGHKTSYEPVQGSFADLKEQAQHFDSLKATAKSSGTAIRPYLDSGVTLSNTACEIWFSGLAKTERDTTLGKDLMNVVGNFILGVSGINGASATSLGRGALGLAAANTAFEVYRADILLGSISEIRGKIREDRKVAADSLMSNVDVSFDTAQRRLLEYHQLCSVERIKLLLNTSLAAVKFERPDVTLGTPADKAKALLIASNLKPLLGDVDLLLQDTDLLYQVYLAVVPYRTADDSDPEVAKAARKNSLVTIYTTRLASKTAAEQEQVTTMLQQIAVLMRFGERLKKDIASGANQKQHDAEEALKNAAQKLSTRMVALAGDTEVRQALGIPAGLASDAAASQVIGSDLDRIKANLNALLRRGARADVGALIVELEDFQNALTRHKLAAAIAQQSRRSEGPLVDVTPKIVPVSP